MGSREAFLGKANRFGDDKENVKRRNVATAATGRGSRFLTASISCLVCLLFLVFFISAFFFPFFEESVVISFLVQVARISSHKSMCTYMSERENKGPCSLCRERPSGGGVAGSLVRLSVATARVGGGGVWLSGHWWGGSLKAWGERGAAKKSQGKPRWLCALQGLPIFSRCLPGSS